MAYLSFLMKTPYLYYNYRYIYSARHRRTPYAASGFLVELLIRSMIAATAKSLRAGNRSLSAESTTACISLMVKSVQYIGAPGCCRHESTKEPVSKASNPVSSTSFIVMVRSESRSAAIGIAIRSGLPVSLPFVANESEPMAFQALAIGRPSCC